MTLLAKAQRDKNYRIGQYGEQQVFMVGVRNQSDKAIAGVAGELEFIDIFDKKVGAVSFKISETIEPGRDFVWVGSRDYNQFLDAHRAGWNLAEGKYSTRFLPEMMVFADGSKLKTPE